MIFHVLTGAVLGLSVAAPFGPVALLCVQRSIAAGPGLGVVTGAGAACVQVLYASLAITVADDASASLASWGLPIRIVSCSLLIGLGIRVLLRPPPHLKRPRPIRARVAFASAVAVGMCNPLTIMPYVLIATATATAEAAETALTLWSVPGVFAGALSWYSLLSGGAALLRSGLPPVAIRVLNGVAGAMLIVFGLMAATR